MKFAGKWKTLVPMLDVPSPVLQPPVVGIPCRNPQAKSLRAYDVSPALAKPRARYTGTAMLGIATMHKSNAVPVFTETEAVDIAQMRR
jgi:hypothetical protein